MNNVSSVNIALRRFLNNHCNISTEKKPKVGTMLYSYRITSRVLFSTQYHRQHCTFLNSLEHFICTTSMTIIPADRASNPVHLRFEPQLDLILYCQQFTSPRECVLIKNNNNKETPL